MTDNSHIWKYWLPEEGETEDAAVSYTMMPFATAWDTATSIANHLWQDSAGEVGINSVTHLMLRNPDGHLTQWDLTYEASVDGYAHLHKEPTT